MLITPDICDQIITCFRRGSSRAKELRPHVVVDPNNTGTLFCEVLYRFRTDQSGGSRHNDCTHLLIRNRLRHSPKSPSHITLRNRPHAVRPIADLPQSTACEKVNVPRDILSHITRIEGNQTTGSHQSQVHIQALKHFDKFSPSDARLFQSSRPKLE